MTPRTLLTGKPPPDLTGHKVAAGVWRRLVGLYNETEGTIITSFDADVLVKYCLAEEELLELSKLRNEIKQIWERHCKALDKMKPKDEDLRIYYNALAQANALLQRFQGMDARMDGKRKLVFSLAQSLYLTPRSRAGVAPPEREPEQPKSPMEEMLD